MQDHGRLNWVRAPIPCQRFIDNKYILMDIRYAKEDPSYTMITLKFGLHYATIII